MITNNLIDYSDAISTWTQGFVGRQWLRQAVDGFLTTPEQRCFLLSGEPRIGKTAFLAHLSHERPAYVHHFVSAYESDWNLPVAFVQSVGAQLGRQFGLELLAEDEPPAQVHADVDVGHAEAGASIVGVLIQQYTALPIEDMARRLIQRPVERLAKRQQGPVVARRSLEPARRALGQRERSTIKRGLGSGGVACAGRAFAECAGGSVDVVGRGDEPVGARPRWHDLGPGRGARAQIRDPARARKRTEWPCSGVDASRSSTYVPDPGRIPAPRPN